MSFYHKIKKNNISSSKVYGLLIIPAPNDSLQNIYLFRFYRIFLKSYCDPIHLIVNKGKKCQ